MLEIVIDGNELWDEENECFVYAKPITLHLEHSLVSLSKWEAKYKKSFLKTQEKTMEETLYYFKCMTITKNVKDEVYTRMSPENFKAINEYINDPMTATYIPDTSSKGGRGDTQTAEVLYYQMLANGIPMECQKWHLNRLITLIRVFNFKNDPKTGKNKLGQKELLRRNWELNKKQMEKYQSKG